ncbi:hypothetical protein Hanom_Chr07g00629471 [Helianthus anomalus]
MLMDHRIGWQSNRMTIRSSILHRERVLDWNHSHNIYCILDEIYTNGTPFKDTAEFLRKSRINKPLTDQTTVYESQVRMFWKSARYDESTKKIHSSVQKKDEKGKNIDVEVMFNVGDLRRVLGLGDSDNDPTIVPQQLCKGLWFRMGFEGHVNDKYLKSLFSYDETSGYIMNIITCLVLNWPYNVSQVLFDLMVDNINGETYIMYPRFIQIMINDQVTDLPKDPTDIMKLRNMKVDTLSRLDQYKLKNDEKEPGVKHMICKFANPIYVAPENDAWRHDNSNSEDESYRLRDMHEKKLRYYWFVKDGKRKRTPKASPTVTAPKVSTPKIVVKGIPSKQSPPLVDEPVVHPTELIRQGADILNMSYDDFLKKNEEGTTQKVQSSSVQAESVKEKQPEVVVQSDSEDVDDESTDTEPEIDMAKVGLGKVQLKKKPQKKRKGSDEENSTYMPTAEEKKKLRTKRKAVQSGVIPRNVRVKKSGATKPEFQSGKSEKHVATSKGPETATESQEHVKKDADDESSRPKKTVLPDLFEGFPNIQGEYKDDILFGEEFDMFHDATVKDLKKKISLLEKEKEKAEAEHDELKKQLEELSKVNEEIKSVMIKHAKKIKNMEGDVDDNAKLFEQLSMEITDLHLKNKKLNEINQTLYQLISELHEASANEFKAMKLEMEALRADKAVKNEQLNMLYTVMEHHLGIDVQSIYNNIEIKRVEERRAQREKELAEAATQRRKEVIIETQEAGGSSSQPDIEMVDAEVDQAQGFVLIGEATLPSYSFDDIIRLVQVEQRKRKEKEPKVMLLQWKEEEKVVEEEEKEDEELEDVLDVIDNYDPSWDDLIDKDDDDDQGSTGLLIVNPSVQQKIDDFMNDEINEQEEDQQQESSSSGKKHADQVFLTQPTVIYLNAPVEGEIEVPRSRAKMLEELGLDDRKFKFDIEDEIHSSPEKEYEFKYAHEVDKYNDVIVEEGSDSSDEETVFQYSGVDETFPSLDEMFKEQNEDEVRRKNCGENHY